MIISVLTKRYNDLNARGEISARGWSHDPVSYGICLQENGEVLNIASLLQKVAIPQKGKAKDGKKATKEILRPRQDINIPAKAGRKSDIKAYFLSDNAKYLLGIDAQAPSERVKKCFEASAKLHHELLDNVDTPIAHAITSFFDKWDPLKAKEHPALKDKYEDIVKSGNLIFMLDGKFPDSDSAICDAWQKYYDAPGDGPVRRCLATGEIDEIAATHPVIKGIKGSQPSGASLSSFNCDSFCSYGKKQNFNAPVGKKAAFAYATALQQMRDDRQHQQIIGNTTMFYWAEGSEPQYADVLGMEITGDVPDSMQEDLAAAIKLIIDGKPCEKLELDPNRTFYVLGIDSNSSRFIVRFFYQNSFGEFMERINEHYAGLEIEKPAYEKAKILPLWQMMAETVKKNAKDKSPSATLTNAVFRSIWTGDKYPTALFNSIMLRIRADRDVNWKRAAIIKAYMLRNIANKELKEVLIVGLNENSTNIPYTLGRLFALLEYTQKAALKDIKSTIKDKYLNSASSTPSVVYPMLIKLCQHHLRKLNDKQRIWYSKQITELMGILGETYPVRLNLAEQGTFMLGYYHQVQKFYTKKDKDMPNEEENQ